MHAAATSPIECPITRAAPWPAARQRSTATKRCGREAIWQANGEGSTGFKADQADERRDDGCQRCSVHAKLFGQKAIERRTDAKIHERSLELGPRGTAAQAEHFGARQV